ncbi:MAG TPA: hypothetical protein VKZ99_02315 [Gammaproteobacteria bacterium]|nr:hypothetical protein [Gammaproteobacteria bacterium]
MAFVTFEEIVDLIDSTEQRGGGMTVYFKCPRSGRIVEARGAFPESARRNFLQVASGSTIRALLHRLSGVIRQYTGIYIPLGNTVENRTVPGDGRFVNEADRRAAAIAAFESVAEYPGKPVRRGRFNHIDNQWTYVE